LNLVSVSVTMRRRRFLSLLAANLAAIADSRADAMNSVVPAVMPALFVGHGSPLNVVRDTTFTRQLRAWGTSLPRPAAILSVSAHWLTPGTTAVSTAARPQTIYDFGGFPPELYRLRYPAPGAPTVARRAAALARGGAVAQDPAQGLDHGTWTVLRHMFPEADLPVFQLSIDYDQPAAFHYRLGQELYPLREQGVLILGSGNVVHNLRATVRDAADDAKALAPWAQSFDDFVNAALAERDDRALIDYRPRAGALLAVPTPDHYFPLLYALGASDAGERPQTRFAGFQAGTISMRCVQFGAART
jgi:4,5-DOPA dioxygenase extradiol